MKIKHSLLALGLGLALSGAASAAPMSEGQAEGMVLRAGFTDVSRLTYQDGSWRGTARNEDGELVRVRVDPVTREMTWLRDDGSTVTTKTTTTTRVVPVPDDRIALNEEPVLIEEIPVVRRPVMVEERVLVPAGGRISKSDVRAVLAANGFHDIHDIDWLKHRHVWKAEARDASGDDLEVHVDPIDGRILHVEDD